MRIYHKAYVYLTCGNRLLVFDEPDTPELGLQVPGGTIDPGESYLIGARREFIEETGLTLDTAFEHFADQDLPFETMTADGGVQAPLNRPLKGRHLRKLYHARIDTAPKEKWEHFEMSPSNGGPPIRFRLFWLDLHDPRAMDPANFFAEFGAQLEPLRQRIQGARP
ncbi:NUDIX domain-containing protein [uncultured Roseibium sp.]|uniref:NUDIX hydrolase n=1 Tax=uncultured Roseibium sp. TaxID=1936171 RepID=UPI002596C9A5|nr:NUDIX domain-containing protein [uncultured Roseibium sp.]